MQSNTYSKWKKKDKLKFLYFILFAYVLDTFFKRTEFCFVVLNLPSNGFYLYK